MTITATCTDCGDEHPLGDRSLDLENDLTTRCPHCGSPSYTVTGTDVVIEKSEDDRIRDAVADVSGVGEETIQNLIDEFGLYAELERAEVSELTSVDGVGRTIAQRIQEVT